MKNELNLLDGVFLACGILCILVFVIFLVAEFLQVGYLNKKNRKIIYGLFGLSIAMLAFTINPEQDYDLYEHYLLMDEIRNSGYSFIDLFKQAICLKQDVGEYPTLVVWNLLRDIIISLGLKNNWLTFISTLVVYSIFGYITIDWFENNKIKRKYYIVAYLIAFSGMPMLLVTMGMRTALAISIISFGVYQWLYKRKSILIFILYSVAALTIHETAIFAIVAVVLTHFVSHKILFMGGMFFSVTYSVSYDLLQNVSNQYLRRISDVLFWYENHIYKGELLNFYVNIIIAVALLIVCFMTNRKNKNDEPIVRYCITYLLLILPLVSMSSTVFFNRQMYMFGPLTAIVLTPILKENSEYDHRKIIKFIFWIMIFASLICTVYYMIPFLAAIV